MATVAARSAPGAAPLFQPLSAKGLNLKHRIVLAPLTRLRNVKNVPGKLAVQHYADRATDGGLLISEATVIDPTGYGYPQVPGIHTAEQIEAWKPVTAAVHAKGGVFFSQIWHVGRVSLPAYQPGGQKPVAPSAIRISSELTAPLPDGSAYVPFETPRALEASELPAYRDLFVQAARSAIEAGFDGVEVHGGNGYLLDQFLKSSTNTRTDAYGGSIENRARFPLEVIRAVADAIGPERTGVRFAPFTTFNDANEEHNPYALFLYVLEQLNDLGLAFIDLVEPRVDGQKDIKTTDTLQPFREVYKGTLLVAGGHTAATAAAAVGSGAADLIAFGRPFTSNPDLVERVRVGASFTPYERATFYAGRPGEGPETGYNDWATLASAEADVDHASPVEVKA